MMVAESAIVSGLIPLEEHTSITYDVMFSNSIAESKLLLHYFFATRRTARKNQNRKMPTGETKAHTVRRVPHAFQLASARSHTLITSRRNSGREGGGRFRRRIAGCSYRRRRPWC